jgi:hypothetical protein
MMQPSQHDARPFDPLTWPTRLVLTALVLTVVLDAVAVDSNISYYRLIHRVANEGDISIASIAALQAADDRQHTIEVWDTS